jgi:C-terminal processing protease CtpA/Prc
VQAAFQILRKDYIRGEDLNFEQLNRAALEGLIEHLGGGAKVVPVAEAQVVAGEPEVRQSVLADGIGWIRPMTFGVEEVALWTAALQKLKGQGCDTVLLDLREAAGAGSFEVAAAFLETVVPSGQVLFKLKQSGSAETEVRVSSKEPVWAGQVVVLVDGDTGNVGEAVAAVLQHQRRALVVGKKTRGATVRYQTLPLDAQFALQYASAELLLEDGSSLFQKGLEPDLVVGTEAEEKEAALERMAQGRVRELVHEVARERFNEAALVARRNPELEVYLKRSAGEETEDETLPPMDAVLQRAVDAVQAKETLARAKLSWKAPAEERGKKEEILKAPKAVPVTGSR